MEDTVMVLTVGFSAYQWLDIIAYLIGDRRWYTPVEHSECGRLCKIVVGGTKVRLRQQDVVSGAKGWICDCETKY